MSTVLVIVLVAESNSRKEGLISGSQFEGTFHLCEEGMTAGHAAPAVWKQRVTNASAQLVLFFYFSQSGSLPQCSGTTHI